MSGGFFEDLLAGFSAFLAGVAGESDRRLAVKSVVEELLQLLHLAVGQGVHRVDDDRLDALARPFAEHAVDDRDDVRK